MFNDKKKKENRILVGGIVMRPSWKDTLLSFKVGEERTFDRTIITTSRARVVASQINSSNCGMRFSIRTNGPDDSCTIRRDK